MPDFAVCSTRTPTPSKALFTMPLAGGANKRAYDEYQESLLFEYFKIGPAAKTPLQRGPARVGIGDDGDGVEKEEYADEDEKCSESWGCAKDCPMERYHRSDAMGAATATYKLGKEAEQVDRRLAVAKPLKAASCSTPSPPSPREVITER
jgi:hypothetical protein